MALPALMVETPSLQAVFFDVGGTLVRPRLPMAEVVVRSARAAGVRISPGGEAAITRRLESELAVRPRPGDAFTYPPQRSRERWMGVYRASLTGVCSSDEAEQIAGNAWMQLSSPAGYELFPDALPTLHTLSAAGLVLGVVSNWEAWLPDLLDHLGISDAFECVVASSDVHAEKPEAAIFAAGLRAVELEPNQVVHVGDSATDDVTGAIGTGMRAVFLDRSKMNAALTPAPVIHTLTEVPPLVRSWRARDDQAAGRVSTSERFDVCGRSIR